MKQIALYRRDHSIRAYAIADDDVFDDVSRHPWCLDGNGYVYRRDLTPASYGSSIYLARYILGLVRGDGLESDHVNRNRLDNRRENLRALTKAQNQQNRGSGGNKNSSSSYRGVGFRPDIGRWRARFKLDGKEYNVGTFKDEHEAGRAVSEARAKMMPFTIEPECPETRAAVLAQWKIEREETT